MRTKALALLLFPLLLAGCSISPSSASSEKITPLTLHLTFTEKTIMVGETFTLTLLDQFGEDRIDLADWEMSDYDTVSRNNDGLIGGYQPGEVDVTAIVSDYIQSKYSIPQSVYTCHITVTERDDPEYLFFKEYGGDELRFEVKEYTEKDTGDKVAKAFYYEPARDLTTIMFSRKIRRKHDSEPTWYNDYTYRATIQFGFGDFAHGKFSCYYENYLQTSSYRVSKQTITFKNDYLEFDSENQEAILHYASNCFSLGDGNIDYGFFIEENCLPIIARFNEGIDYANGILDTYGSDLTLF